MHDWGETKEGSQDGCSAVETGGEVEDVKEPLQQKVIRTLEDGPTSRQKLLVISIWIFSALFGASTCFPDKGYITSIN